MTIAGAHSTSKAHARSIWNDGQVEAQPLQRGRDDRGVYFTPFDGTGDLRRYLKKAPRDVEKEHGIDRGHGEAVVLFSVHQSDRLLKDPSPMKTGGREAIVGDHLKLGPDVRLAMVSQDRTQQTYTANDSSATTLSMSDAVRLLCEVSP